MWFLLHVVMNWRSSKTWKPRPKGGFDEGLKKNPLDLSMGRSQVKKTCPKNRQKRENA
jgi:hypothetical protein